MANQIAVARDPQYAPVGFLVCRVIDGRWNTRDDANTVLVDSDWEFPSLAQMVGWQPCHDDTDGTVQCARCGRTATNLITDAYDYLDSHQGTIIDNPDSGYFAEE